ncbi:hypothetical protein BP6252_11648 [Coleophoma cylindrospora]|uniref:Non-structural maintenance of chromosomes element 4 n=1 Tax=Coleophoma cylindrospora TaxID=1849047 RepID=A0A3D8QK79_9HELO|nr:hypothetical protein BP6252_11648 [Coleophoma cylindrospora]
MPRAMPKSESPEGEDIYEASPGGSRPPARRQASRQSMSPSPSSDKENRALQTVNRSKRNERAAMAPSGRPSSPSSKRKRTAEHDTLNQRHQRRRTIEVEEDEEDDDDEVEDEGDGSHRYDPDQDIEERRVLRKSLRELSRQLIDNRSEYMKSTSKGLLETLEKANDLAATVKQTADATIDSRILVNAAEMSYRRTLALTTGDASIGVDVDEFLSKCITYMRRAEGAAHIDRQGPSATQREREQDEGDMYDWEHLGRFACLPNNHRPSVPGFLLGPLSQERRARKATTRRAAFRPDKLQESRPEVLDAKDVRESADKSVTALTEMIHRVLAKTLRKAIEAAQAEAREDMTLEEERELMERYGISADQGLSFFKFVVNPHSFGQTVENIFYVSFLIRDGKVGISTDDYGMPFLEPTLPREQEERTEQGIQKHQAIIAIDMDQWETLIELFDIKKSLIPHREEAIQGTIGARGWYA